ncbi:low temperature requirement protein A [Streptomyces sp. NPDC052016]|uniref:low temperature requirement protein A n=1 Tax=Streptomyces sp. NPDC052016 TaxID=3365680 RepID=UPI0037D1E8E7
MELFFDLCFVVAVAQASMSVHGALTVGDYASAALCFARVFFTIWWARMNFAWFASAYDCDDVMSGPGGAGADHGVAHPRRWRAPRVRGRESARHHAGVRRRA